MFAIVVSEKGGAERRELFDKHEINVGRVQGNDLMLPKGNVSKRHARLIFRDGRFIVTDLKSTNGTYVNGRKIAQATIVREGDKIYVGDFVLRVELTPSSPGSGPNRPSVVGGSTATSGVSGSVETAPLPSPVSDKGPAARPSLTFEAEFTARHDLVGGSTLPESGEGSRRTGHDLSEHVESTLPRLPSPFLPPRALAKGPQHVRAKGSRSPR